MVVAIVCVGLLGWLVVALGFSVSMARRRFRIASGCPEGPTLSLAARFTVMQ